MKKKLDRAAPLTLAKCLSDFIMGHIFVDFLRFKFNIAFLCNAKYCFSSEGVKQPQTFG